jgi:hypothetical protein
VFISAGLDVRMGTCAHCSAFIIGKGAVLIFNLSRAVSFCADLSLFLCHCQLWESFPGVFIDDDAFVSIHVVLGNLRGMVDEIGPTLFTMVEVGRDFFCVGVQYLYGIISLVDAFSDSLEFGYPYCLFDFYGVVYGVHTCIHNGYGEIIRAAMVWSVKVFGQCCFTFGFN